MVSQDTVNVYASPLPFSNKQIKAVTGPGIPVQEVVDDIFPVHLKGNPGVGAIVLIDGRTLPRSAWGATKVQLGQNIVVRIVPQGGGGKKNPLVSLLSIAILVAAPYISTAILGTTLANTAIGIGSLTYGGLLSGAIGVIGRLALSALAPPPKASSAGRVSNPAESPTQFIEGARNAIDPYGVVPVNLGTNRMFPKQAARPYTETQDSDQYVRQLMTYGWGPEVVITDHKIGETDIDEYDEFEIEHRLAGDLHEGTSLYSNDVYQEDLNVTLNEVDGFTTRTTQIDTDEIVVDVTFPRGLAAFNSQGGRGSRRIQLELQYAPTGTTDWSNAAATYTAYTARSVSIAAAASNNYGNNGGGGTRIDIVAIHKYNGSLRVFQGGPTTRPTVHGNYLRLAEVNVTTTRDSGTGILSTDITVLDVRPAASIGFDFENTGDFLPSKGGSTQVDIAAGGLLVNELDINGSQTEPLRKSVRIVTGSPGQYDIRIRRLTADTNSDQIFDTVALTAIKSVKYQAPVNLEGINGSGIRIKATDQLNGALDQFNVVVSTIIPDYDPELDDWVPRITSNPASIYRYVLQGLPNGKRLADSKVLIEDLEEWHTHCVEQGYTYNRVIDYVTTVDEILRDVASAGAASPAVVDGKRTIVVDKVKDDIIQVVTPRNSWGYQGEMLYPELPHALRVQFRNEDRGYIQDERIVYFDGYDINTATDFEVLELQSCTNADLAYKIARRHMAAIILRPETHTWIMDVENLVALRGNRIVLEHDAPLVGVGDGRIKSITDDGTYVTSITIDDTIGIPDSSTYYVRIRLNDGTFLYEELTTSVGNTQTLTFANNVLLADTPEVGDLVYVVEVGGELDLIITRIEPQDDLTARIAGVNYAPEIFVAESESIPPFDSNITIPLEFIRPIAPTLIEEISNEDVMVKNSDGSLTSRAVFTLENLNGSDIEVTVRARVAGTSTFFTPDILEASPERVVITGLQDGTRYDIHFRYRRRGSTLLSLPLELNNYLYVGASGVPNDVTGFIVSIVEGTAFFEWDNNDDIDLSHYKIKYSNVYSGATWTTAQNLKDNIVGNNIAAPFLGGTYLIKAVDLSGNESADATAIITYDPGRLANAVQTLTEELDFTGVLDNVVRNADGIKLADPDSDGYYYFKHSINLDGKFPTLLSASVVSNGVFVNDLFDYADLFAVDDLFGSGGNDLFASVDLFAEEDMFGIGTDGWNVDLEYAIIETDASLTDPNNNLADTDYASWGDARGTITVNATTGLEGVVDAHKFVESTDTGQHYVRHTHASVPLDETNTYSIFLKSDLRHVRVRVRNEDDTANYFYVNVDLSDGSILTDTDQGNATLANAQTTEYGDGWWRLELTGIVDSAGGTNCEIWIYSLLLDETFSFTGDDTIDPAFEFYGVEIVSGSSAYEPTYGAWTEFAAGVKEFWGIKFRLKMESFAEDVSPLVSVLQVNADMPDRIESGEDLTVTTSGYTVNYAEAFRANPSVQITIQDGDADDEIQYTSKTVDGFTFKVYNTSSGTFVERTFDYIVSGYGRKST